MASKPKTATRASARTKQIAASSRITRAKSAAAVPPTKKTVPRKPPLDRDNAPEILAEPKFISKQIPCALPKVPPNRSFTASIDTDREPILAYLRIRPYLGEREPSSLPYLTPLSDTTVRMTDPRHDAQTKSSMFRPSVLPQSSIYTFSHVFPPLTTQSDFFTKTTLPLIGDVLQGQNALLFTYGVTNSGKTYTVQGGSREGSAGIVPRTLDVVFNSIEGLQGDGRYRPVRLRGIEHSDAPETQSPQLSLPQPVLSEVMAEHLSLTSDTDVDPTILQIDRNFEYSIWLSYVEVYNEKVYDLLETVKDDASDAEAYDSPRMGQLQPLLLTRKALHLKPCPPSDFDPSATTSSGKYIFGLRQFRVQSAAQAKTLVRLGQIHRRVFGTLANRESSRSHGMVILKVVKVHRALRDDPTAFQVSRLTLVDLAGSERTKHTQTTGDRLREAGNINKSLMVLGQCMEVMRANQRRVAMSLAVEGVGKDARVDTRDVKKGLAVVPFRHSKLTEALMDYFVEDGRVVMIVNVNPYDTGYDENSNVMKFAALAREVYISTAPAPTHRFPSRQIPDKATKGVAFKNNPAPYRRKVTISMGGGRKISEAIVEVLEEDEGEEDRDGDEPINPLVDALFDEVEELRMRLFESEMNCAIIEAETREEVMREMEERMRGMEKMYARRLMDEVTQNEMKTDAKIDMLQQSGLLVGSPTKQRQPVGSPFEEDSETILIKDSDDGYSTSGEEITFDSDLESPSGSISPPVSPPLRKSDGQILQSIVTTPGRRETRQLVPDGPEGVLLPSDEEELTDMSDTEDSTGDLDSVAETGTELISDSEEEDVEESFGEDEWVPTSSRTPRAARINGRRQAELSKPMSQVSSNRTRTGRPPRQTASQTSRLAQKMDKLSLSTTPDDPMDLLRTEDSEEDGDGVAKTAKQTKRQLEKKLVPTDEDIEEAIKVRREKQTKKIARK